MARFVAIEAEFDFVIDHVDDEASVVASAGDVVHGQSTHISCPEEGRRSIRRHAVRPCVALPQDFREPRSYQFSEFVYLVRLNLPDIAEFGIDKVVDAVKCLCAIVSVEQAQVHHIIVSV